MAKSYNLTLQLNLQGPANLNSVTSKLKKQLSSVGATSVDVKISNQALKSIDLATKKFNSMNKAMVQVQKTAADLNKQMYNLSGAFQKVSTTGSGGSSFSGINNALNNVTKNSQKAQQAAKSFWTEISGKAIYQAKFNVINAGLALLYQSLNDATQAYIDFERNLNRIKQLGGSAQEISNLSKEIRNLATNVGVSSADLAQVSVVLKQAGNSADEARTALKALSQASLAPTFSNMTNAVEGTVAVMSQFQIEAEGVEGALDSINTIAGKYAVEFDDLVQAVRRGGGAFKAAAGDAADSQTSLNQFLALFSTVRSTTRESSETIATGLRTITARLQKISTQKKLKDILGVDLVDNGKFIGAYEAIDRISSSIKRLNISTQDTKFSEVVEAIGGVRQFSRVIPLLTETDKRIRILQDAQNSAGSTARDAAKAQDTLAVQLLRTKEAFNDLFASATEGTFGDVFKEGLKGLQAFLKGIKTLLPALVSLGSIKVLDILSKRKSGGGGGGGGLGGLLGGIGGGGGGGGGGLLGSVLTLNTASLDTALKDSTAVITQHLAAIKSNNIALNGLTTAILNLTKNPPTTPIVTPNSGGLIKAFASGGVVPGTGNRDTVPAMLTPGEFVIRKNAVKALGTDQLHQMNKYNTGGPILDQKEIGAAVLGKKGSKDYRSAGVSTATIDTNSVLSARGLENKDGIARIIEDEKKSGWSWKLVTERADVEVRKNIDRAIQSTAIKAQNDLAKHKSLQDYNIPTLGASTSKNSQNFIKSLNDSFRGNLFEQIISVIQNSGKFGDKQDPRAPFDFIGPFVGKIADIFPNIKGIKYKDAKASTVSLDNFSKKIGNQILKDRSDAGDISASLSKAEIDILTSIKDGNFVKAKLGREGKDLLQGLMNNKLAKQTEIAKNRGQKGFSYSLTEAGQKALEPISRNSGGIIPRFAQGGRVSDEFLKKYKGKGIDWSDVWGTYVVSKQGPSINPQVKKLSEFNGDEALIEQFIQRGNLALGSGYQAKSYGSGSGRMGFKTRRRYAEGGSAEDTVPALLTPGEFVINKKAAARIGKDQLSKLNKADKISAFNSGGAVGSIQKFASGGSPTSTGDVYSLLESEFKGSAKKFAAVLRKQIVDLSVGMEQAIKKSKRDFVVNTGKIRNTVGLSADQKKESALQSVQGLAAGSGQTFDPKKIEAAATDLFKGLEKDLSFEEIIKSSSDLAEIFESTLSSTERLNLSILEVAEKTGIDANRLNSIASSGAGAQAQADATSYFNNDDLGKQFQSIFTNVWPAQTRKLFDNSFMKPFARISKEFTEKTGFKLAEFTIRFTAATNLLVDQMDSLFDGFSDTSEGRLAKSTLGGAQTGSNLGGIVGKALGGDAGAAIGSLIGSIAGGITSYFKAVETKSLQDSMTELRKTTERLSTAMSTLEANVNSAEARGTAERELRRTSVQANQDAELAFEETKGFFNVPAWFDGQSNAEIIAARERFAVSGEAGLSSAEQLARQDVNRLSASEAQRRLDEFDRRRESGTANSDQMLENNSIVEADVRSRLGARYATATPEEKERERKASIEQRSREAYIQREMQSNGGDINLATEKYNKLNEEKNGEALAQGKKLLAERDREILLLKASSEPMAALTKRLALLGMTFRRVGDMIGRFDAEFDSFNARVDDTLNSMAGQGTDVSGYLQTRLNVLQNPNAYSAQTYNQASEGYGTALQGAANAQRFMETSLAPLLSGNQEITDVDALIDQIKSQSASAFGFQGANFDQLPANIRAAMEPIFTEMQENFQQGEGSTDLSTFADRITSVFSETGQQAQETLVKLEEQRIKVLLRHQQIAIKINQLELQRVQHLTQASAIMQDFSNSLKEATGQTVTLDEMNANFENDVASLTGGSTDPAQIYQQMQARELRGRQLKEQLGNARTNGASEEDQRGIIDQIQANQAWMDRQAAAMEKLATSSETQANAFKKFTERKERAKAGKTLMDKIMSGDFEQIFEASQAIDAGIAGVTGDTEYFANNPAAYSNLSGAQGLLPPEMMARAEDTALIGQGNRMGLSTPMIQQGLDMNLAARGDPDDPYLKMAEEAAERQAEAALMQAWAAETQRQAAEQAQEALADVDDPANMFQQGATDFLRIVGEQYPRIVQTAYDRLARDTPAGGQQPGGVTRNSGGPVFSSSGGSGGPNKDTVPAMLTPGEFVINRNSTKKHRGLIEAINSGKPVYANKGGPIYLNTGGEVEVGGFTVDDNVRAIIRKKQSERTPEEQLIYEQYKEAKNHEANARAMAKTGRTALDRRNAGREVAEQAAVRAQKAANADAMAPYNFLSFVTKRAEGGYLDGLGADGTIPLSAFDMAFSQRFGVSDSSLVSSHKSYPEYRKALDEYNGNITRRKEEAQVLVAEEEAKRQEALATARSHTSALSGRSNNAMAIADVGVDTAMSGDSHIKTWRDKSGKFSVSAKLSRVTPDGKIELKFAGNPESSGRKDGDMVTIDPADLDTASLQHLSGTLDMARTKSAELETAEKFREKQLADQSARASAASSPERKAREQEKEAEIAQLRAEQKAKRDAQAADQARAFEANAITNEKNNAIFAETRQRIADRINAEESSIAINESTLKDAGFLTMFGAGGLQRDEIKVSKQKIAGYQIALDKVRSAEGAFYNSNKVKAKELLDSARGLIGLPYVEFDTGNVEGKAQAGVTNRVDKSGQERLQAELDFIEQQKEIGVQGIMAVGAPIAGVAAIGSASVLGAMTVAAAPVLAARGVENAFEVGYGEKSAKEAAIDVGIDTGIAAGGGAVGYGVGQLAKAGVKSIQYSLNRGSQMAAARGGVQQIGAGIRPGVINTVNPAATEAFQQGTSAVVAAADDAARAATTVTTVADDIGLTSANTFVSTGDDLTGDAIDALFRQQDIPNPTVTNVNSATGARGGTNLMNGGGKANMLDELSRLNLEGPNVINTSTPGARMPYGGARIGGGVQAIGAAGDDLSIAGTNVIAGSADDIGAGTLAVGRMPKSGVGSVYTNVSDDAVRAAAAESDALTKVTRASVDEARAIPGLGKPADFMGDVTQEQLDDAIAATYLNSQKTATKTIADVVDTTASQSTGTASSTTASNFVDPAAAQALVDDLVGGDFGGAISYKDIQKALADISSGGKKGTGILDKVKGLGLKYIKQSLKLGTFGAGAEGARQGISGAASYIKSEDGQKKLREMGFMNKGGPVYANKGLFVPRGTDTVPAMLTPGEFVINRDAAQKHQGLLQQINSGTLYKSRGGPIYRQNGGSVSGGGVSIDMTKFDNGVSQFLVGVNNFGDKITTFTTYVDKLANLKMPNIPDRIEMVGNHNVQVEIRGSQVLEGMADWAQGLVQGAISERMNELWVKSGGQLGSAAR